MDNSKTTAPLKFYSVERLDYSNAMFYGTVVNNAMEMFYEVNKCLDIIQIHVKSIQAIFPSRINFGNKRNWQNAMNAKREVYQNMSREFRSKYYFFMDSDVVVVKDPSRYLVQLCDSSDSFPMYFSKDRYKASGGFVLICDINHAVVDFYFSLSQEKSSMTKKHRKYYEQVHIDSLLKDFYPAPVGLLDEFLFADGYLMNSLNKRVNSSFLFHTNYCKIITCKVNKLLRVANLSNNTNLHRCIKSINKVNNI